jgi:toxin ParE1/3/4
MPPVYRVNLTLRVADQLQEIFDYIAKDSPDNAARLIRRLLDAMDGLESLPHRYKVVTNSATVGEELRSMPVGAYLVRYHVHDSARVVTIVSVRHGARAAE